MSNNVVYGFFYSGTLVPFCIGKTNNLNKRLNCHLSGARIRPSLPLHWKLRKLCREGIDYRVIVLATDLSPEGSAELECKLIAMYGNIKSGGLLYNLTDGGDGTPGLVFTDTHRARLSTSHMGLRPTEETRARMREAHKDKGEPVAATKASNEATRKEVAQYTTEGALVARFPSIAEAARYTGGYGTNISKCCLGKRKFTTVDGTQYAWAFF
jgi:hypothetical protein